MILVTGGTGLVGSHLLYHLVQDQPAIRALYRSDKKLESVRRVFSYYTRDPHGLFERIEWVKTDLNDLPGLEKAFENITDVYHCAALISFNPADLPDLIRSNEMATANVVNQCIARNINKLCYVSSIAAIGKNPASTKVAESNEWQNTPGNPYALTKHLAEMEVWRGSQEGIPVVIVNPGVILGPGYWETGSGKLFQMADRSPRFYPPGGTGFVTVEDVVRMMIQLMHSEIKNERFLAVGDNLSYFEILTKLGQLLNKRTPTKMIPHWLLGLLWRLDWLRHSIGRKNRKLTKAQAISLRHRVHYDSNKANEILNFNYQPLDEYLAFCCEKFRESYPVAAS